MAPDTQSIDFNTNFLILGLAHLLPLDNSIDSFESAGTEILSAAIKRVDLEDDEDEVEEDEDDDEYEDDKEEEDGEDEEDEYEEDEDEDDEDEEDEDDDLEDDEDDDEELNLI